MREIRFRGKRRDDTAHNDTWVYGHYFTAPLTDENSGLPAEAGWFFLSGGERRHCIEQDGLVFTVDPATVGQFTGLRDTNDKEIYEGDIVLHDDTNWGYGGEYDRTHDGYLRDVVPSIDVLLKGDSWVDDASLLQSMEIIGNIHDNLALLEATD